MKRFRFLYFIFSVVVLSCKEVTIKINQLPSLSTSDSAIIMYYHTPGDSRFFNIVKVEKINPLPLISKDVNDRVVTKKNSCATEGKIYFYKKAGAVEAVYFSRAKDCMTFSFIKTGEKYYTRMSKESQNLLDSLGRKITILKGREE